VRAQIGLVALVVVAVGHGVRGGEGGHQTFASPLRESSGIA
jgi:hypothetical protein